MSQAFFLQRGGVKTGPFTSDQIQGFSDNGKLQPTDLVYYEDGRHFLVSELASLNENETVTETEDEELLRLVELSFKPVTVNPEQLPSIQPPPLPTQTKVWFYSKGGGQLGPYSEHDLLILLGNEVNGRSLLIWKEGMHTWVEAGSVFQLPNLPIDADLTRSNRHVSKPKSNLWKRLPYLFLLLFICGTVVGGMIVYGNWSERRDLHTRNIQQWKQNLDSAEREYKQALSTLANRYSRAALDRSNIAAQNYRDAQEAYADAINEARK